MKTILGAVLALTILGSTGAWCAEQTTEPEATAGDLHTDPETETQTLPQVETEDRFHNAQSLSSTLERGMDNRGLTMEEKWSHDVIVCAKTRVLGSRLEKLVCHTRGDWRAMRENGRALTRSLQ
ncbi:MAG: hypothetical protein KDI71_19850 [Xanthomonadales bacterium]|nr:hypothetical protein [Xanthomonadales bacterium]